MTVLSKGIHLHPTEDPAALPPDAPRSLRHSDSAPADKNLLHGLAAGFICVPKAMQTCRSKCSFLLPLRHGVWQTLIENTYGASICLAQHGPGFPLQGHTVSFRQCIYFPEKGTPIRLRHALIPFLIAAISFPRIVCCCFMTRSIDSPLNVSCLNVQSTQSAAALHC